ncbi:MAG: PIN domain-containing protein, partial [Thermomicrobiales bacterium]
MGLVIDSSVFITLERRGHPVTRLTEMLVEEVIAISTITASELLVGVHRADSLNRRMRREAHVEQILAGFNVLPFDIPAARVHAELGAALSGSSRAINAHDLLI